MNNSKHEDQSNRGGAKTRWRKAGALALSCALAIFIAYAGMAYPSRAQTDSGNPVQRGKQDFLTNCAFCHGPDATGARGPDLVRSKLVADDVNGSLIGEVIRNGRPQKGMPAFSMASAEIGDIAAFLHSRVVATEHSRAMGSEYPLSRLLTGNATRGEAYFNGAGGCTACHSATGNLAHVASKYSPLNLELRMLYPRGEIPTVTVTLSSGATVTGQLEHLDEFTVALRDPSGWHRSFSRSEVKVDVHDPLQAHRELLGKLTQDEMHNVFAYLETLK